MTRNKLLLLLFVVSLLGLCMVCCVTALAAGSYTANSSNSVSQSVLSKGDITQTVAIIKIEGIISSQTATDLFGNETPDMASGIIRQINHAQEDDNVKAILLEVNSPGGEAYASKLIYNKLIQFKESGKPIVVLMKDSAASGGYYVSLPADEIVASSITTTGSIGVIVTGTDLSGLYEKAGIEEFNVVNSEGNLKVLENLTDEESEGYAILQGVLDDVYDDFVTAVATNRGLTKQEAIELADGRIYSGRQAEEVDLIDTIGETETARESVEKIASLTNPNYVLYSDEVEGLSIYSLSLTNLLFPELSLASKKSQGVSVNFLMPY